MLLTNKVRKLADAIVEQNESVKSRTIATPAGDIILLYVQQLTDRTGLSDYIIRPVQLYVARDGQDYSIKTLTTTILQCDEMTPDNDFTKVEEHVLNGMTVMLCAKWDQYLFINLKKVERKSIADPQITYTLRGPKDSFTENLETNLSLIRYRLKDNNLKTDKFSVGRRTKTNVIMMYMEDIANSKVIGRLTDRINDIDVDGIIESGEFQSLISDDHFALFPQMGIIERSDMACSSLLEGKIIILVEGSGLALCAPVTFSDFLISGDDLYDNKFYAIYSRMLRYIAFVSMLVLTPLYVAVVAYNTEILSTRYTIYLAFIRASVPFNAFTETILVVFVTELLRECLLRVPSQIVSAIGIVGALVIGQSAVAAGIFSPLILIIASMSLLSSFVAPDYTITNPMRILEILLICATGTFGFLGFTMGIFIIVAKMVSTSSFGVPLMAPYAPFNIKDFMATFFYNKSEHEMRLHYLRTKDNKRSNLQ